MGIFYYICGTLEAHVELKFTTEWEHTHRLKTNLHLYVIKALI